MEYTILAYDIGNRFPGYYSVTPQESNQIKISQIEAQSEVEAINQVRVLVTRQYYRVIDIIV